MGESDVSKNNGMLGKNALLRRCLTINKYVSVTSPIECPISCMTVPFLQHPRARRILLPRDERPTGDEHLK